MSLLVNVGLDLFRSILHQNVTGLAPKPNNCYKPDVEGSYRVHLTAKVMTSDVNSLSDLLKELIGQLHFDDTGLVPAIAQQHDTGEVLMMAWMNLDSITETLQTGRVVYWSRSRQALWRKGETSGQTQELIDFRIDCDGDTLLRMVNQVGVACHTGRRNCFFRAVRDNTMHKIADVQIDPKDLYGA